MPRRSLFHKLREHAGFIGVDPFRRHRGKDLVPHTAIAPVWNDLLFADADALVGDRVTGFGPRVQNPQVFRTVAGQLRIGGHELWLRAAFAHDQFVIAHVNRLPLAEVEKRTGSHHGHRVFTLVGLVEIREQTGPLVRDGRGGVEALSSKSCCSFIHCVNHRCVQERRRPETDRQQP